jgi:hypothetical protein
LISLDFAVPLSTSLALDSPYLLSVSDMHGELQPIAAKMTKAMSDSLSPNMRMVGSGLCMEKFEDNPVVYEHFAEVMCV